MTPTVLALAFTAFATPQPAEVRDVSPNAANMRAAVEKVLPVLWKGVEGHSAKRTCFTCHSHAVPLLAITTADARGFPADAKKLAEQTAFISEHFNGMKDRLEKGNGPGPGPVGGGVDNTGYALLAFDTLKVKPNTTTTAVAHYTLGADSVRGFWPARGNRPPSEASDITTTALAIWGLVKYTPDGKADAVTKRVKASREWLLKANPRHRRPRVPVARPTRERGDA